MLDEIIQSSSLDRFLKFLDKKNFFYPGARILGRIIRSKFLFNFKPEDYNIWAIGQSHLDAAWLWRRIDTICKANLTFSNALKHIEDYPFFIFAESSPQYYEWMEKYFPEKFEQMKMRIKEGRMEIVGGMWIEPDLNCTGGESLVRQRLLGQRYYLEKFGKVSEIGWLTDTFGYCWTLPQILAKSGAKYFYTNKMSWNDTTKHPFIVFYWQAPDGSKVLTYSFPYTLNLVVQKPSIGQWKEYASFLKNINEQRVFNYEINFEDIKKQRSDEYIRELGFVYGLGDGGGGPLRAEIIYIKEFFRHKQLKFCSSLDYFKLLEKYKERLPIWNDELYLEYHRGCYTSHVWLKALNRKTEFDLYNLEILSSIASFNGVVYPKSKLKSLWKVLLFNQFHDILPGSSIPEVYQDVRKDFKKIHQVSTMLAQTAIDIISKKINIPSKGLLIFNWQSWNHDALIEFETSQGALIKDKDGNELVSQKSGNKHVFIVKDIPSIGYTYISTEPTKESPKYESDLSVAEKGNLISLENQFLKVQVDKSTGLLTSIYHKKLEKEILTTGGNRIQIYKDKMALSFAAWNISRYYSKRPIKLEKTIEVEIKEIGPVRGVIEVRQKSEEPPVTIVQKIILLSNTDRVDFHLYMKYHIKSTIVKLSFPFNVETEKIHCEIPFGVITRSTRPKTKSQAAQWEIPAQKWVDVSQKDFGVTLINKSRYGFDARYHPKFKNVVRMTILRVPQYPRGGNPLMSIFPTGKYHEQTEFSVDYSLHIHKGDWKTAHSYLLAHEFNNPPLQIPVDKNTGTLPSEFEFLKIIPTNVLLSAMKAPEDEEGRSLVVRVFETAGTETDAEIKFPILISIERVSETDLLELNPQTIDSKQHSLKFKIKPFEIKTFLIKYQISRQ